MASEPRSPVQASPSALLDDDVPQDTSGHLLWIAFAAILNVAALILLFAIFRDTTDTAKYLADNNRRVQMDLREIQAQQAVLLQEVQALRAAQSQPAGTPPAR